MTLQKIEPFNSVKIAIFYDTHSILSGLDSTIRSLFESHDQRVVIETFQAVDDLLERALSIGFFDIYFLDIDILGENGGLALAKKICLMNEEGVRVYISEREEMLFELLQTQPMAFVRKQHFTNDISSLIEWICDHLAEHSNTLITVYDETKHAVELDSRRILYVEAKEKYQDVFYADGRQMLRCSMNKMEEALTPWGFFRVHRSYLVNLLYVRKMEQGHVVLENGVHLPVSRQRRKVTQEAVRSYLFTMKRNGRLS